jgi:hypothetical protein
VTALGFPRGGASALLRHAVAAVLNATHPAVAYPLTAREVIDLVNAALASGNAVTIENLKNQLDRYNNPGSDLDAHGQTGGKNLLAETAPAAIEAVDVLRTTELGPVVTEAVRLWTHRAGVDQARLAGTTVRIVDQPGLVLGRAEDTVVMIDPTAAGHGWFVDATPWDDAEFQAIDGAGTFAARPGGLASGRVDLLTVVAHELGHVLGLDHVDEEHDVLAPTLGLGRRALPPRATAPPLFAASATGLSGAMARRDVGAPLGIESGVPMRRVTVDWDRQGSTLTGPGGSLAEDAGKPLFSLLARNFWEVRSHADQPRQRSREAAAEDGPEACGNASIAIAWDDLDEAP